MSEANKPYRHANLMLGLLILAYIISFIDRQILSLLVGPIRADLKISDFEFSLLQGASFAIFYTTLGIPMGWLADRYRRTAVIGVGAIVWSLSTIACGLSRGFGGLFLSRIGVGAGEAALSPAAFSLIADAYPPSKLARAIGFFVLAIPIGSGLGFMIGGAVIELVSHAQTEHLPILGTLKPWQMTFLIVGLPGILLGIAMLMLKEPVRRKTSADDQIDEAPAFRTVLGHIGRNWSRYGPIFASMTMLSASAYAMLGWYPTFLIRRFDLGIGQVGMIVGAIYLFSGPIGSLGGPLFSEFLLRRGYADARIRTVGLIAATVALVAAVGLVQSSLPLVIASAVPLAMLLNSGYGVASTALQTITPNRMRGVASALMTLGNGLGGLMLGSALPSILTDFVFKDDRMIGYSLAITVALTGGIAALSAAWGCVRRGTVVPEH